VQVVDCSIRPRFGESVFGEVSEGKLTLNGRVVPLKRETIKNELEKRLIAPSLRLEDPTLLLPELLQQVVLRGATQRAAQGKQ